MNDIILPLMVGVPLAVAGLTAMAPRTARWVLPVAFATLVGLLVVSVLFVVESSDGEVLSHAVGAWPAGIAIPFAVDQLTALMLTATGLLIVVCSWFAVASGPGREPLFAPLLLVVTAGVNGALLTADIFNLFVFIEVMLLPSYGLLVLAGRLRGTDRSVRGSRLYVTFNLFVSTLFLVGVGFVYGTAGTVNLGELAGRAEESPTVAAAVGICLVALSMKAATFPAHGWLAQAYPTTSPAMTALFSGLHTKVAVYAIYRIYSVVFDGDERYLWIGLVAFSLTMVVGVLGAVGEQSMRSILVFNMVSGIGYVLIGLALFTGAGIAAGLFYLIHHMIVMASLLMTTGAVEVRHGGSRLGSVGALARREPVLATAFWMAAISLAGLPPFSGFVGKVAIVIAAADADQYAVMGVAVAVSLLTLLSVLKIWDATFMSPADREGDRENADDGGSVKAPPKVGLALAGPGLVLAVATLALGIGGEGLLALTTVAADGLLDTSAYVEAVLS